MHYHAHIVHVSDRNCPLCDRPAAPVAGPKGRWLVHCTHCDLIAVPDDQHLAPDAERSRYELHENTLDNPGYVARFERLLDRIEEVCSGLRTVLDFGCGPGPVLVELLRRRGFAATGYDPFFAPDADLSAPFDLVISTETFEHFCRPRREIQTILRLLRPGGYLAVMTQFHPGPDALADWWYLRDETHVAFYSPATFAWIGRNFGFRVIHSDDLHVVILQRTAPSDDGP